LTKSYNNTETQGNVQATIRNKFIYRDRQTDKSAPVYPCGASKMRVAKWTELTGCGQAQFYTY